MNIVIMAFLIPLILLGSSIAISLNSSLLNTAEQTTQSWESEMQQQKEKEEEEELLDKQIEINGRVYNSVDEYLNSED